MYLFKMDIILEKLEELAIKVETLESIIAMLMNRPDPVVINYGMSSVPIVIGEEDTREIEYEDCEIDIPIQDTEFLPRCQEV